MTKIVNLNRARKKKRAAESERRAEENRAKFGRTKAERARQTAEQDALSRHVAGHKREGALESGSLASDDGDGPH